MTTATVELAYLGQMILTLWVTLVVLAFVFSYVLEREAPHLVFRECFTVTECLPDLVTRIYGWEIPLWYGVLSAVTLVLITITGLQTVIDLLRWWRTRRD